MFGVVLNVGVGPCLLKVAFSEGSNSRRPVKYCVVMNLTLGQGDPKLSKYIGGSSL